MAKTEADMLKKIEVWWLLRGMVTGEYKRGGLSWGENGSGGKIGYEISLNDTEQPAQVRFQYSQSDIWSGKEMHLDYAIPIVKTPCHFGGFRYWFTCQGIGTTLCGKRAGVLYKDGLRFACRHCYDLTYSSRKISANHPSVVMTDYLFMEMKIEKLAKTIRRKTWRGVPTRKYRELQFLEAQQFVSQYRCMKLMKNLRRKKDWGVVF